MISLANIKQFYTAAISGDARFHKYLLKEYIQLMILDYLSNTSYVRKLVFIGGTNLRLVKGIDRFSEDLHFDCKDFSTDEFMQLANDVVVFIRRAGLEAVVKDKESEKLTAMRRSIHFPGLMFEMGLSGHKDERFMIKLEAQDQNVLYNPVPVLIKGCGFYFSFPVPPDPVLCAMKLSALLSRGKGRDFYDAMFLLAQAGPDFDFLAARAGVKDMRMLKERLELCVRSTDLHKKQKDFEHLLFNKDSGRRIQNFPELVRTL